MAVDHPGNGANGRVAFVAILLLCGLVAVAAVYIRALNADPIVSVPTPTLPNPNAFDYDLQAGQAIRDRDQIDVDVKEYLSENAVGPDAAAVVADNKDALALLRKSFAYPYLSPPIRSLSTESPYYGSDRRLGRLLTLQAGLRAEKGDWNGSGQAGLDAMRLGVDVPRGSTLIGMLVGYAIEGLGRRSVWRAMPHLTGPEARAAAARLSNILGRQVPPTASLQEEKWATEASLQEIMRRPNWQFGLILADSGSLTPSSALSAAFTSKRSVMADYSRCLDAQIRRASVPFGRQVGTTSLPSNLNPVEQAIIPTFDRLDFRAAETDAKGRLLLTSLALRAYDADHHAYPASVAALVPAYLPSAPIDPFAVFSAPLIYRQSGFHYTLYSVGPDRKDNGGRPIFDPSMVDRTSPDNPSSAYAVTIESKGDIVAGVND